MSQDTKIIGIIGLVTLLIIVGAVFFLSKQGTKAIPSETADTKKLIKDDSHKIATDGAKVTIVEFADFQCPACGAVHPTTKQIIKEYSGKITFVFRHFPLQIHKNAQVAAQAAEAAGEQKKFWEMHDLLFENQRAWSDSDNPIEKFVSYASSLQLDTEKFRKSVENNTFAAKIRSDQDDGIALYVDATPTFFINGQKYSGVLEYDEFKTKIDVLLKK